MVVLKKKNASRHRPVTDLIRVHTDYAGPSLVILLSCPRVSSSMALPRYAQAFQGLTEILIKSRQ